MAISNIVPECYLDTSIAEILTQSSKKYHHVFGKGQVANALSKGRLRESVALGIIDEDKNKGPIPKYFLEFEEIRTENNLILRRHKTRKQFLILICPEIEQWLLKNAVVAGIDPRKFNLPDKLQELVQLTKIKSSHINMEVYRFIKALINEKAPGIMTLKDWIEAFQKDLI